MNQLKNLRCAEMTTLGLALKNVFDILNINLPYKVCQISLPPRQQKLFKITDSSFLQNPNVFFITIAITKYSKLSSKTTEIRFKKSFFIVFKPNRGF